MAPEGLTKRQASYRVALEANLQKNTGRALREWLNLARRCPETAPRARLRWFKAQHGLGQNYAMRVLEALDRERGKGRPGPRARRATLWREPDTLQILRAIEAALRTIPHVVAGQRKGYTVWSRAYAFAAARPLRGQVRLGLALKPAARGRLEVAGREGWSERLQATVLLRRPADVDRSVRALLRRAWERS